MDYGSGAPRVFELCEYFFAAVFVFEMVYRMWDMGLRGYFGDSNNWLDFVLVWLALIDLVLKLQFTAEDDAGGGSLKKLQVLKVVRLLRILRMLRTLTMFRELVLIVKGMLSAVRSLVWMFLLLTLFVFASACFFTEMIGKDPSGSFDFLVPGSTETVAEFFPDVLMSMYTLFYCLGEGCSEKIIIPVIRIRPELSVFFLFFLCMTTYGFL